LSSKEIAMRKVLAALLGDERIRFLLVGGINTVIGYGLFALLYTLFGTHLGYLGSLYLSYIPATIIAFVLHRHFTFRVSGTGRVVLDFLRFSIVYVVSLAINTVLLPVFVEVVHLPPLVAQAISTVLVTVLTYFGHKLFSFRRGRSAVAPASRN
jgi:putative flippase GtrA